MPAKKDRFDSIADAIEDIRAGKMVVVLDDENRENEGDLVMAASKATPEAINFMATHARGLICVPMRRERLEELMIPSMVPDNTDHLQTAFTVSVDAKEGTTTGISAADRARTIQTLIDPYARPEMLARPGHIFPLRSREGGVLRRAGHTEASVDLAVLAGLYPAGVICEIMSEDGTMARAPELHRFARQHKLRILTIKDLIEYRQERETLVEEVAECPMPTALGEFQLRAFRSRIDGKHHMALVYGDVDAARPTLVRVHSQCLTGDVFGSLRCDCGSQLYRAMAAIVEAGRGVLVYLRQEGRGIGIVNKLRAYALQDEGLDTVDANLQLGFAADLREYGIGAQILRACGVRKMVLLTNNPKKLVGLDGFGLEVVGRESLSGVVVPENADYLRTKQLRMGHLPGVLAAAAEDPGLVEAPEKKTRKKKAAKAGKKRKKTAGKKPATRKGGSERTSRGQDVRG